MTRGHRITQIECIYCTTTNQVEAFDREHVLPEAFGKFKGALVIHEGVCKDCNSYFGRTLDLLLSRESFEGLARYQSGLKPPAEISRFKPGRVEMTLGEAGPLKGTRLRPILAPDGETIGVGQEEQVSVEDPETGTTSWYTEVEVMAPEWPKIAGLRNGLRVGVHASNDATRARIEKHLQTLDPNFKLGDFDTSSPTVLGRVLVNMKVQIDIDQMRAAAKICFNYLASQYGNTLALEAVFNDLRAFVRYGVRPPGQLVFVTSKSMVDGEAESTPDGRVQAHLIAAGWTIPANLLVGQLSLLNLLQYRVILAPYYEGRRPVIEGGHVYNIATMEVHRMTALHITD